MTIPASSTSRFAIAWQRFLSTWDEIWFQRRTTAPLEVARIGTGLALLLHYGMASQYLFSLYSNSGWFPRPKVSSAQVTDASMQSILFYFNADWQLVVFHAIFLFCCAALMAGWRTSWVKWVVLIGHVSYAQRSPDVTYGVDSITASILFLLCLAPVGRMMSLDRARQVRKAKRLDLTARPPVETSAWGFACTRLMQIQMAVLFFFSALHKIRETEWWQGDAIWRVFVSNDYHSGWMLDLLASQFWLVNIAVYGVVIIELAFPFLIWQTKTRPWLLVGAIFVHLLFFVFLNLHYFSFVMIIGHMSFLRHEWLEQLGAWWKRRIGEMEMIYDGRCGFCVRSMAWFLAFDGLDQIKIRNFRKDPSSAVSDEEMEKALYLVLPDGR